MIQERPDLIIYMSDSKQIKPEDLIEIFDQMKINTPCILITDSNHGLLEEKITKFGNCNATSD